MTVSEATGQRYLPNYKRQHVGLLDGDQPRTFVHCNPRIGQLRVQVKVTENDVWRDRLEAAGIRELFASRGWVRFNIDEEEFDAHRVVLSQLFRQAAEENYY